LSTSRSPTLHIHSNDERLDDALLRELNAFRLSVMRLKPTTDEDLDFASFSKVCRRAAYVAFVRDSKGSICSSFVVAIYQGSAANVRFRAYVIDYAFARLDMRGDPTQIRLGLRILLRELRSWRRGEELWVGGIGYPASALTIGRLFQPFHFSSDDDVPGSARSIFEQLRAESGDRWEGARHRVSMPTIPPRMPARWYQHAEAEPTYDRFIAQCPEWTEGYGLAFLGKANVGRALADIGTKYMKRWVRTRRPESIVDAE
jgi:hypothetical protein